MSHGILFVGSKDLGLAAFGALADALPEGVRGCVTIDDSADSRSALARFEIACGARGIPLIVLRRPSELQQVVRDRAPRVVLVVGWYWLLKPDLLAAVPDGFVGIHGSLLPRYRGNAPLVWTVLRGDREGGVSMFWFDEGMDTGDLVGQRAFAIGTDDTIADVLRYAEAASEALVREHAAALLRGTAPRRPQDPSGISYVSARRPEDGGIDWRLPAVRVHDWVRAQTRPYPGAFCSLRAGGVLRVWRTSVFPHPYHGLPGLVVERTHDTATVTCGDGAVVLRDWTVEAMPADSADPLRWGARLGSGG